MNKTMKTYNKYIAAFAAVAMALASCSQDDTFAPDAGCSRAQIVTFLWRAEGTETSNASNPFADVAADDYFAGAVAWAVENEITSGTSATTFSPDNACTRAQIVTFLYRCLVDQQ